MTEEKLMEIYKGLSDAASGKRADHFLFAVGNFLSLIAHDSNVSLMTVLARVNTAAIETHEKRMEEYDGSTRH